MSNLFEDTLGLFGLQIKKKETEQDLSGALSTGLEDDGSTTTINSAALAGSFGTYVDTDGQIKTEIEAIRKYREISLFAEVDVAIQEIVNEAIPQEQDTKLVKLDMDNLDELSDSIKSKIQNEFDEVVKLLNYDEYAVDYFRKWYVDGRLPFQIIVDKNRLSDGIQKMVLLDAQNVKKVREVTTKKTPEGATVIEKVEEYFLYNDAGFGAAKNNQASGASIAPTMGLRISPDAIVYATSGLTDNNNGMVLSHLHKAIRPINQYRMLSDATIIYFIARAPERRIFYIDVGNLPKLKAEQYMKDIMNRYRNKMVYDAKTGDVKNDKKYMSMLEDFWMPRRDGGKGTEISSLQGAQNITGYLDSLEWFKEEMYGALNIPKSRLQQENGFNIGKSVEVSRDEVKFQKFIDRLRNKFGQIILDTLKTQLVLKGICNSEEWEDIKPYIRLDFQKDNYFSELKEQEIWKSRFEMITAVDDYLGKYISKEWIQRDILKMSDEDIEKMDDQIENEKGDETAQPNWKLMGSFQASLQPPMPEDGGDGGAEDGGAPPGGAPAGQPSPSKNTDPEFDPSNYKQ